METANNNELEISKEVKNHLAAVSLYLNEDISEKLFTDGKVELSFICERAHELLGIND